MKYDFFRVFNMFARKIDSDDPSKERLLKLKRKLGESISSKEGKKDQKVRFLTLNINLIESNPPLHKNDGM